MSLPMKGLSKVKDELIELKRKFKMFSVRCDHSGVRDIGQHHRVACCNHEGYDYHSHPALLCLFDCCPITQGKED